MTIAENLRAVQDRIAKAAVRAGRPPGGVTLLGVTKGAGAQAVQEAFDAGVRAFGENRVQEAEAKLPALAAMRAHSAWHMIGHLQTNKVSAALATFDMIQSVGSLKMGEAIHRRAEARVPVLIEVNVAGEATKEGFALSEVAAAVEALRRLDRLDIRGLMTVAPLSVDPEEARPVFRQLRKLASACTLSELSMGMSNDFEVAIEEGATMVRIGTAIFGTRPGAR